MNAHALTVLDLFSGIGGFSLGLERAGMRTVAFCEIEPYCRAVLRKHWPHVPIYEDVRELTGARLSAGGITPVDLICGGFPCQDISVAGRGAGLRGDRSGLWSEFARLIREIRPRYAIVENVSALLSRGLGDILGELAEIGYDSQWHCIPASAVGAPHRRDRIWIVAYPGGEQHESDCAPEQRPRAAKFPEANLADADGEMYRHGHHGAIQDGRVRAQGHEGERHAVPDEGFWSAEPEVDRVAYGVPARVDRLRALGNAVVPQVVEEIGRAIMRVAVPRRAE